MSYVAGVKLQDRPTAGLKKAEGFCHIAIPHLSDLPRHEVCCFNAETIAEEAFFIRGNRLAADSTALLKFVTPHHFL